jgi:Terpene synthase family 2, C-terminal metal binding
MKHAREVVDELPLWFWLEKFAVVKPSDRTWFDRIQATKMTKYAFGAPDPRRFEVIARFVGWLFFFDDGYPENALAQDPAAFRLLQMQYAKLLGGDLSAGPQDSFGKSLADILKSAQQLAPRDWLLRLGQSTISYFDGCEIESVMRTRKTPLGFQSFFWFRERSIGVYPMVDCIEFTSDRYLTPEDVANPSVQGLRRAGTMCAALDNDLFSARKESRERAAFNSVLVYQREHQVSFDVAFEAVVAIRNQVHDDLEVFQDICIRNASEGVKALVDGIPVWLEGNCQWSMETPRYNEHKLKIEPFAIHAP